MGKINHLGWVKTKLDSCLAKQVKIKQYGPNREEECTGKLEKYDTSDDESVIFLYFLDTKETCAVSTSNIFCIQEITP